MTTKQALIKTRQLIRKGWCQHKSALNRLRRPVDPHSPTARYWCLTGALTAAANNPRTYRTAQHAILHFLEGLTIIEYNDLPTTTQAKVIQLLTRALKNV